MGAECCESAVLRGVGLGERRRKGLACQRVCPIRATGRFAYPRSAIGGWIMSSVYSRIEAMCVLLGTSEAVSGSRVSAPVSQHVKHDASVQHRAHNGTTWTIVRDSAASVVAGVWTQTQLPREAVAMTARLIVAMPFALHARERWETRRTAHSQRAWPSIKLVAQAETSVPVRPQTYWISPKGSQSPGDPAVTHIQPAYPEISGAVFHAMSPTLQEPTLGTVLLNNSCRPTGA
jgi:hypothetical protein